MPRNTSPPPPSAKPTMSGHKTSLESGNRPESHNRYTVIKRRHPWRVLIAVLILILAVIAVREVMSNSRFGWDVVAVYFRNETIVTGIWMTLFLTVVAMIIGIVLGIILAVMRISSNPILRASSGFYVQIFRATPQLVQLLLWFNLSALYPVITFGIPGIHLDANSIISPVTAAILGLGLNEAAFMCEIIRSGIISIDEGQTEAAGALGMKRSRVMRRIVLPQAMRVIIPPTGNQIIDMLKLTSLVSVIAVPELLYSSQLIYTKNLEVIPLLLVATIWYVIMSIVLSIGQYYVERHFARGASRTTTPTLWQIVRQQWGRLWFRITERRTRS